MSDHNETRDGMNDPQVWCPNREQHDGHWYTIRAGNITVAGGWCRGESRMADTLADTAAPPE